VAGETRSFDEHAFL
jgi:probable HAF family extracellular repeat protein